jgi:hypothetical protein
MVVQAVARSNELRIGALVVGGDAGIAEQPTGEGSCGVFWQHHAVRPSRRPGFCNPTLSLETAV